MFLSKARIKDMAEYTNRVEYQMNYIFSPDYGDDPNEQFLEARGAYLAALRMAELAGVHKEVHEVREQLKEAS